MRDFFKEEFFNTKLFESEHFIVVPSLGAMVEGWLLVVPKKIHLNLGSLSINEFDDLEKIIAQVERSILSKFGSKSVLFEHGPKYEKSIVGCGVDYAHLHIVPLEFDLLNELEQFSDNDYDWQRLNSVKELSQHVGNGENNYLYHRNQSGEHFLAINDSIPSQLFRKVIAHYLKHPEAFDWKENLCIENIQNTINKFKTAS